MSSLINKAFQKARNEKRTALLTYTVAGDNTKKKSLEILKSISNYADICELGFPHNTPIADGGQIQTSAYRAIKNKKFSIKCKKKKINFIQLVSPTTSNTRLKKIIKDSHDMIYYISMLSTTGGKLKVSPKKILERYSKIKNQNKSKNVVIGFGITEKTIKSLKKADGLVVGSQICKEISKSIEKRQNAVTNVTNIVKRLKNKIK